MDTLQALLLAELASHRGQLDLALDIYRRQAFATRDVEITARAVSLAHYLNAAQDAADLGTLWLELAPDNPVAHAHLALALSALGQSERAFEEMQRSEALGGDASYARLAAEALKHSNQQRDQLAAAIDQALRHQPRHVELLMAASILLQSTDTAQALSIARQARAAAPDAPQPVILEATLLQQLGQHDAALVLLHDQLPLHPTNIRLRQMYASIVASADLPKALREFKILLDLQPQNADIIFSVGMVHAKMGQFDEASQYFQQLITLGKKQSTAYYHLGLIARQQRDPSQAVQYLSKVEPGQDFLAAMSLIANILLEHREIDDLRELFASRRQQFPDQSVPLYILETEVLGQLTRYDAADTLLSEALAQHPGNTRLLYTRSLLAEKSGDPARAERYLRHILEQEPSNSTALNALGYMLTNHSERYEEALALIEEALRHKPGDPTIIDSKGWALYKLNDLDSALKYLEAAYSRLPDAEISAHLGEVLWKLGRQQDALKIWQEALNIDADNPVLRETVERFDAGHQLESPN